ncbi:hypothetical protein F4677DRAFT_441364 [Hypoxylon crocopeplum]|nr:hypothetical protein F4677DRAFT_441364 [Hypoxylon crocopeplum]
MATAAYQDWDKQEVQDLKSWIFGSSADQARQFFWNIFRDAQDATIFESQTEDSILFFCNTDTLEVTDDENNPKNPSGKKTWNNAANMGAYGDGIKDCEPTSGISGNKAYTANFDGRSYIMLCPWYLEKMKVVKVPTQQKFSSFFKNPLRALDKGLDKIIPDRDMTPMDAMSLLEQTLLHEVTHTLYAGHSLDIDKLNSYDWKNVVRLSSNPDAYKNAESLAFFGLGVTLIEQGYGISQDGNLKKP